MTNPPAQSTIAFNMKEIPVENRENKELAELLRICKSIDLNGYCILTDGTLDNLTDKKLIEILKQNIKEQTEE